MHTKRGAWGFDGGGGCASRLLAPRWAWLARRAAVRPELHGAGGEDAPRRAESTEPDVAVSQEPALGVLDCCDASGSWAQEQGGAGAWGSGRRVGSRDVAVSGWVTSVADVGACVGALCALVGTLDGQLAVVAPG